LIKTKERALGSLFFVASYLSLHSQPLPQFFVSAVFALFFVLVAFSTFWFALFFVVLVFSIFTPLLIRARLVLATKQIIYTQRKKAQTKKPLKRVAFLDMQL
jgi:hypothetical protein